MVELISLWARKSLIRKIRQVCLLLVFAATCLALGHSSLVARATPTNVIQRTGETISLDQYWRLLQQTRQLAESAENLTVDETRNGFLQIASQWEQVTAVRLPDGSLVLVNHNLLLQRLRAEPPDHQAVLRLVETALREGQNWSAHLFTPADLSILEPILQRPEFDWREQAERSHSIITQWVRYLFDLARRWLVRLLQEPWFGVAVEIGRWLAALVGLLVLIWLVFYMTRGLRRSLAAESELRSNLDEEDVLVSASAALAKAYELSNRGDYRMAVRYLYLSALLQLEENGVLRYDRAKTNREYLRSVRAMPTLHASLVEVIEVFDRVWYGYQPIEQADFERYAAQAARLREQK